MKALRSYQQAAVERASDYLVAGGRAGLIVLPTGAGKSLVIAELSHARPRALILSHDCRILEQNARAVLERHPSSDVGIYCAELGSKRIGADVTVASVQSFANLIKKEGPQYDLILVDEAHRIANRDCGQYRKVLSHYAGVPVIGLTATAYRLAGGLIVDADDDSKLFDDLIYEVPAEQLIDDGYLSPIRYVGFKEIDQESLASVRIAAGEYRESDLEELYMQKLKESAAHIKQHRDGATLVFAVSVGHAVELAKEFQALWLRTGVVTGEICTIEGIDSDWRTVLETFRSGGLDVVVNCQMLTTGYDYPGISTIAICRATKSTSLWVQMIGRGFRLAPGKTQCKVIDLGHNVSEHEKAEKITTETAEKLLASKKCKEQERKWNPYRTCQQCSAIFDRTILVCPECGFDAKVLAKVNYMRRAVALSAAQGRLERVESITAAIHHKPGSPDSFKVVAEYGFRRRATNYYCFDHANAWTRQKARLDYKALFNGVEDVPKDNAVSWAMDAVKSDGALADVTHVALVNDGGWERIVGLYHLRD